MSDKIKIGYIDESGGTLHPIIVEEISRLHKIAERCKKLESALEELIQVKDYKDKHGKDEQYKSAQPIAWKNAREALNKRSNK
jgi:hypothetical protein